MNRRLLIAFLLAPLACTSSSGRNKGNLGGAGTASGTAGTGSSNPGAAGSGSGNSGTSGTAGSGSGNPGTAGSTSGSSGTTGTSGNSGTSGTAGMAGNGSTGGTGGSSGSGTGGTTPIDTTASVLERNKHMSRDGAFVQPTLTKAKAATMALDANFKATFAGGMWASPLYISNGPMGKGVFFAVTTGNNVYALDEMTGSTVWMHSIGMAASGTGAGCGEGPIGISGTPVIDAASRTIYVAGGIGTGGVMRHEVHALSVDDGTERTGWPVDLSGMKSGGTTFNPAVHNQRGSLSLVNGILYVPYGGYNGDCGGYHGWVFAIDTATRTTAAWATGGQGEAIWAAGGMASDGTNIFATTGNSTNGIPNHADSEEIVRLTGMATVDRTTGLFWPGGNDWRNMDQGDADLGASSPVYFEMPGSTPSTLVAAVAKNGMFFVANSKNLGGAGGALISYKATNSGNNDGSSVRTAMATYQTAMGRYVVFNGNSPMCPSGGGSILSIRMKDGSPPTATNAFCAPGGTSSSPITTSTDGKTDTVIWYISNGKLIGADGDTGAMVFGGGMGTCDNVRRWTSPIAVNGRIVAGGDGHLCSWSAH
jgi:hypothetical protein